MPGWTAGAPPPTSAQERVASVPERSSPRLDPFKAAIDAMLIEDTTAPRKQRHTAHRILARLIEEHGAGDAAGVPLFRVALLVRGQRLKGRCPVMQRCADGIMNGLKGGDVVMESREAEHAVLHAQDSATSAGMTRLQPRLDFSSRIKFFRAKKRRTLSMRGAAVWGRPLVGRSGGVDSVHTLGLGLGRTGAGLGRIPYVFGGSPVFARAGTRFESHLGHVFSLFRGLWASECAQTVHLWAPAGPIFVGGRCCGRGSPFFPEGGRLPFGTCSWTLLAWAT